MLSVLPYRHCTGSPQWGPIGGYSRRANGRYECPWCDQAFRPVKVTGLSEPGGLTVLFPTHRRVVTRIDRAHVRALEYGARLAFARRLTIQPIVRRIAYAWRVRNAPGARA